MDFRLKVFVCVAKTLSFSAAAKTLYISQPAVSKHIIELEQEYQTRLFNREGGKISLTVSGSVFLKIALEILQKYQSLSYEMEMIKGEYSGDFIIGASTTIAQYLLPPIISAFNERFPKVNITLLTGNTLEIERMVETDIVQLGMVEGQQKRQNLKYSLFKKDELVLLTSTKNRCKQSVTLEELKSLPLLLRENGSGTLDVIEQSLSNYKISLPDLNILLQIGATEGIKNFLLYNNKCYAIVSVTSIIKELRYNELKIIDIDGFKMERDFSFVSKQGYVSELVDRFMGLAHQLSL